MMTLMVMAIAMAMEVIVMMMMMMMMMMVVVVVVTSAPIRSHNCPRLWLLLQYIEYMSFDKCFLPL